MIENLLEPLVPERFIHGERYRSGHVRIVNPLPGKRAPGLHVPDMRAIAKALLRFRESMLIFPKPWRD